MVNDPTLFKIAEDVAYLRAKEEERSKIYMTKEDCHLSRKECKNGKKLDWRWYVTAFIALGGLLLAVAKYIIP